MMAQRIVAVHFPKAAGSSLRSQFSEIFGDDLALDYDRPPLTLGAAKKAEFPAGKRVVYGHFRPQRYAVADAFWMTFLRHPVENLISIYFFWQLFREPTNDLHGLFLEERPSILDFATYPGIRRLMSQTYFGGFDMERFDFIGFHELRDQDIPRLAAMLDLPLKPEVHDNKTVEQAHRQSIESDTAILRKLTDLLAEDVAFYDRLRNRRARFAADDGCSFASR
jgi:hypothetical protein